ncbi:uncharacterized protein EAE98_001261 [Botrytis deweyae]|uniref:Uncharacterized protein n=1 Tax=Botrytis deweyae TaxID=2478750 RepID=A0ABQ7J208_9HELO|nr:uncharacterized protein EAE98_001261 [Botrytis deweyae]KAF7938924.1 hypothetical protein EAE98_001261 [Botrytis deweyae]
MTSRKYSQRHEVGSLVRDQRHNKVHHAKEKALSERSTWDQEFFHHKQDAGRANDRAKTQERRAERKDNVPAERLSDLAM